MIVAILSLVVPYLILWPPLTVIAFFPPLRSGVCSFPGDKLAKSSILNNMYDKAKPYVNHIYCTIGLHLCIF